MTLPAQRSPAGAAALAALLLATSACTTMEDAPAERIGSATLSLANGMPAGTVQLLAAGDTVTLVAAAAGMTQGARGFHLHTTGQCTAPDFTSAGGHLNPQDRSHGKESAGGAHFGDLPNLVFDERQSAALTYALRGSRQDVEQWVFDADGTAVIIHANADDYRTDPTGNAGARVACGVIRRN